MRCDKLFGKYTVEGLESSVDDYMTELFRFGELLARVRGQLRNQRLSRKPEETLLRVADITLDLLTWQVYVGDRAVELSTRKVLMLEVFLRHSMQVMTREQLLDRIWGYAYSPGANIVNVYVGHLRRKIDDDRLETVRGAGYCLRV